MSSPGHPSQAGCTRQIARPIESSVGESTEQPARGEVADLSRLAPPIPRFWQTVQHLSIRRDLPGIRFMAWDFDQSIANMEPLHHDAFRGAAVRLIQTVDHNFTQNDPQFDAFWRLARRGFGLQEMDTIKVFTKAIARTWPDYARSLLEHHALVLPEGQRGRILMSLTARDRMEPQERFLQEEDYQAAVENVRAAFKHRKDVVVAEILKEGRYTIREIPGSLDLIKRGKAEGLLLGLATGSPSTVVKPILERMGALSLFDATVFNDDPLIQNDQQRKPFPFPYRELTRRLSEVAGRSLDTSEGIAFEDSLTGVRSAHAAGMPVVVRTPSLPWLFKKLLAPAGEFDGKTLLMPEWERTARAKQERLVRELTSESGTGKDKIYLLFQDLSDPTVRTQATRANRQQLSWDNVQV